MSEDSGYIMLNRKFFNHAFWKEERTYCSAEAWLDLIASARFEAVPEKLVIKMKIITINRGEQRASLRYLSKRWNWSPNKVGRFLDILKKEKMISKRTEQGESIVIILNYSRYNDPRKSKRNSNEAGENTEAEQERNRSGTETEQTKESKESKELNKKGVSSETPLPPNKSIEDRKGIFENDIWEYAKANGYVDDDPMIKDFIDHWVQHGKRDKKMLFEKQDSFGIGRRIGTWKRNKDKFASFKNTFDDVSRTKEEPDYENVNFN